MLLVLIIATTPVAAVGRRHRNQIVNNKRHCQREEDRQAQHHREVGVVGVQLDLARVVLVVRHIATVIIVVVGRVAAGCLLAQDYSKAKGHTTQQRIHLSA